MIFHYQQFDVEQQHAAMKVGTDSDLLGTLSEGGHRILDIGTGTGIISLMLAQRYPQAQITAVEIDDNAILDASVNFLRSPFASRLTLLHTSFQDYLAQQPSARGSFDCVVCNPPYFDRSLECPDLSRTRARHSSSLPFDVLAAGAYSLLADQGVFSVCIPPEVLSEFNAQCLFAGFSPKLIYQIKSVPRKAPKRYVLVFAKGQVTAPVTYTYCMRNADGTRSDWYLQLMSEFLVNPTISSGSSTNVSAP